MQLVHDKTDGSLTNKRTSGPAEISLSFGNDIGNRARSRMSYAFRVFAAIYGYKVVDAGSSSSALRCVYGRSPTPVREPSAMFIPARYQLHPALSPARILAKRQYAGEELYLAYGVDEATGNPDWLGEIFEWLSCSYEMAAVKRDPFERIPYSETIFSKQGINPRRPHVNLLMAWMENALQGGEKQALPRPISPVSGVGHLVLCTHDVDFYYTDLKSALIRLLKNLVISCTLYRSPSFLADNSWYMLRLLAGMPVGDYLPPLLGKIERLGFRSTFFAVPRRRHRRDPTYDLSQIASRLIEASRRGFSIALHGSYRSVVEDDSLAEEAELLTGAMGKSVLGGRQHWLRFDLHEKLFGEIDRAGLIFDSTLGFAEAAGFRNGASFAFPPYDFQREAPCRFLEFPLALMDGNIQATCRASGENPQDVADQVLEESRRWGWGGMAVLWHDPMESLQVPKEINRVFWRCAEGQAASQEKWVSADQFLQSCLQRYHDAGLLQTITIPPNFAPAIN